VSDTLFELVLGAAFGVSIGSFLICLALTRKLAMMAAMVDVLDLEVQHLHKGYKMLVTELGWRLARDEAALPPSREPPAERETKH
jgi:hypothetical protein